MIGISIEFTAGRYHATPWGCHVNEGIPEWPPSSWRLLRAMISSWKRTARDIPEEMIRKILMKMLDPPNYRLPRATVSHTRHYMPWDKSWSSKREASRVLIFDTFVAVPKDEPVEVYWSKAELDGEEMEILRRIAVNLPYLGRSESWCEMDVIQDIENRQLQEGVIKDYDGNIITNSNPLQNGLSPTDKEDIIRSLVPKKNIEDSGPLDEDHPLLIRTSVLRDEMNRIDPPGARWMKYTRPRDCFEPEFHMKVKRTPGPDYKVARFALDSPSLPPVTEALEVTSVARAACMSLCKKNAIPLFSGKDDAGNPLEENHKHAHYIATDEDGDGRLDHLTIYAKCGFEAMHREVFYELDRLFGFGNRQDISVVLLGMVEEVEDWPYPTGVFGPSETWYSATPYILTRHPKVTRSGQWKTEPLPDGVEILLPEEIGRFPTESHLLLEYGVTPNRDEMQRDGPVSQLILSIQRRGLPPPSSIEPMPMYEQRDSKRRWLEFKRYRRSGNKPEIGNPYGFKVTFSGSVTGPIILGHSSHFGLGLLLADA